MNISRSCSDYRGQWNIRLEVCLSGDTLKIIGGRVLSFNPDTMRDRLKKMHLHDFWRLDNFDWENFIHAAEAVHEKYKNSSTGKRITAKILINSSGVFQFPAPTERAAKMEQSKRGNYYAYAVRRRKMAYRIARLLGDKALQRQIRKGEFSTALV